MRRRIWLTGATLAALALLIVQGAAADQSYSDPTGDATGGAPDITTVAVANDGAGKITFDITIAGALPAPDTFVQVPLNTDLNWNTGDEGVEYGFQLGTNGAALLFRWDGSGYVVHAVPSVRGSYANGVVHFEVNKSDIGNTNAFFFWATAVKTAGEQTLGFDDAPDGTAVYPYFVVQFPACSDKLDNDSDGKVDSPADPGCSSTTDTDETDQLKLSAGKPAAMTGPARAGAPFTVAMTVTRSDGKPFTGAVACTARAGAATLRAGGRAVAGTARCTMRLPKAAKGKRLTGTITASAAAVKVAKPYAFAIR